MAKQPSAHVRNAANTLLRLSPQCHTIIQHLVTTGSISNMEAQMMHKIRALPRRISDLESQEFAPLIKRERKVDTTGQRYMRYSFSDAAEARLWRLAWYATGGVNRLAA